MKNLHLISLILVFLLTSCYSYLPMMPLVSTTEEKAFDIEKGEFYQFFLSNDRRLKMKVSVVTDNEIAGYFTNENASNAIQTIKRSQIITVKKRKFSAGKTIALAVPMVFVGVGVVLTVQAIGSFH